MSKLDTSKPGLTPLQERAAKIKDEAARMAAEAAKVAAEGKAIDEIEEPLAAIRRALAKFPHLLPVIVAEFQSLSERGAELVEVAESVEMTESSNSAHGEADRPALSYGDRMASYLVSRGNRPATLEQFQQDLGISRSGVRNVVYMQNKDGRFVKSKSGELVAWRLRNIEEEIERFGAVANEERQ